MPSQIRCERCERPIADAPPRAPRSRRTIRCPRCGFTFTPASARWEELRLRSDLVIEAVEAEGRTAYVIKDPRTERFFRVKPLEHFLITRFDGKTDLAEIRRRAREEKNVLVSEEVLGRFASEFERLGLLVRDGERDDAPGRGGAAFDVFRVKLPLANPDRLLSWLHPRVRWCFTPTFVAAAALLVLFAAALALLNARDLAFGLGGALSLEGLAFVVVTLVSITLLHELAHGLTCHHFGGRVTDMGFLLLYFLPCFYCNVSDTYLFREKRKRLLVLFAGGFLELVVWAAAVVLWRIAAPETLSSRVAAVVVAVTGVRSLFNFNPLIKMDGYFLLSDALGVTNLRKEALAGLGRLARRALGLTVEPPAPEVQSRRLLSMPADRFLTWFGGAALVYTAALVGFLGYYSGEWVFDRFGHDGLGLFSLALLGLLHKPVLTTASTAKEVSKEKWEKLGEEKRRRRFVFLWLAAILAVAFFPWQLRVTTDLVILPQERETVRAPADGRIARIRFREGDRVRAGDLLLEYDTSELELERRTKEAELVQAREALRLLEKENPTAREEIRVKERALETARAVEAAAQREFERTQEIWTLGLISMDEFEDAKHALEEAEARTREAEAEIALSRKSSPDSRIEQMERLHLLDPGAQQAAIETLEAELAQLDELLARTKIYASVSGTLTTYRFEEKVGEYLEEGSEVCEIVNDERVVVEMPVPETEMDVVEIGKEVHFKVRGFPGRRFRATVDEIAPVATRHGDGSAILVRSRVDNDGHVLKPGMTGVAKIYCGLSFVANILTRDIVRFVRTEFWL